MISFYGMLRKILAISVVFYISVIVACAQSNVKEGNNSFALYTKTKDIAKLLDARKYADAAYVLKRDSFSYRNNLLRAMVYSSLAVADPDRKQSYKKDPIDETFLALSRLNDKQLNFDNQPKIVFVKKQLSEAFLQKANQAISKGNDKEALNMYKALDSLKVGGDHEVGHNLALLYERLGQKDQAIAMYKELVGNPEKTKSAYILSLAKLYDSLGNPKDQIDILLKGREQFPKNKDILFELVNTFANAGAYDEIVPLLDDALGFEPGNVNLNYLAGYANEVVGNRVLAENFYKKVISLDANNYNGNFELGLLYLRDFLENPADISKRDSVQIYLLKANEIDPNAINALKSLALFYNKTGDFMQLERVNSKLNQISLY
ncbi:Tetratricopeptide repeat-containing protein [bacterium A37T11]|nr:Tetratricopeptide repeat-containing protein [bacterium A37T11]